MQGQSEDACNLCQYFAGVIGGAACVIVGFDHVFQALQARAAFGLITVRAGAVDIGHGGAAICIG